MRLQFENQEIVADKHNAFILHYPNDMMNGLYVDLDEEYFFLSATLSVYREQEIEQRAAEDGILTCVMQGEIHGSEPPHCYVVASLGRLAAHVAEEIANGEV